MGLKIMSISLNDLIYFLNIDNWPDSRLIRKKKSAKKVSNVKVISDLKPIVHILCTNILRNIQ